MCLFEFISVSVAVAIVLIVIVAVIVVVIVAIVVAVVVIVIVAIVAGVAVVAVVVVVIVTVVAVIATVAVVTIVAYSCQEIKHKLYCYKQRYCKSKCKNCNKNYPGCCRFCKNKACSDYTGNQAYN